MPLFNNGTITGYDEVPAGQIIAQASNIKVGENPAFVASDFLAFYPQFKNSASTPSDGFLEGLSIPDVVFNEFLSMANSQIQQVQWHSQWKTAMCLFIAHNATLYLASSSGTDTSLSLTTAESVGDVSASYDVNVISDDLQGYGDLKATSYGQQLASKARLLGKAGMMIW
jgi:hypothetical protein